MRGWKLRGEGGSTIVADLAVQAIGHAHLIAEAAVVLVRRLLVGEAVNATVCVSRALVAEAATVLAGQDLVAKAATVLVGRALVTDAAVALVGPALVTDATVALVGPALVRRVISFGVSWS